MSNFWKKEEDAFLEERVYYYPVVQIVRLFQKEAKKQGWVKRTDEAIKRRLYDNFPRPEAIYKNYTISSLARALGVTRWRVEYWQRMKYLEVQYATRGRIVVTDAALKRFAKNRPDLLSPLPWYVLAYVFGEAVANKIRRESGQDELEDVA